MAVIEACKEVWLKELFKELSDQLQISTLLWDSQSAIFLTKAKFIGYKTGPPTKGSKEKRAPTYPQQKPDKSITTHLSQKVY